MRGGAGFDPAKELEGITVNRRAHGYAFTPNPLFDPDWKEEEKPRVIGGSRSSRSLSPTPMPRKRLYGRGHRPGLARGRRTLARLASLSSIATRGGANSVQSQARNEHAGNRVELCYCT